MNGSMVKEIRMSTELIAKAKRHNHSRNTIFPANWNWFPRASLQTLNSGGTELDKHYHWLAQAAFTHQLLHEGLASVCYRLHRTQQPGSPGLALAVSTNLDHFHVARIVFHGETE